MMPPWRYPDLGALRGLIAIIMAFCLTFAPLTTAGAAKAVHASASIAAAGSHMPDCHKAKHGEMPGDRGCCDNHSKSKCPDGACGCLFNCGAQTVAMVTAQEPIRSASIDAFHTLNSAQPPGLRLNPPGPPPRVLILFKRAFQSAARACAQPMLFQGSDHEHKTVYDRSRSACDHGFRFHG